jgi:3-oxoacyl-[acyl-carrier protein] reductase
MDLQIAGKTALITASSSGIGLAAAIAMAAEGANVVLNGRDAARLKDAKARLRTDVPDAWVRILVADVGTGDGVRTVTAALPDVDILVNAVGAYGPADFGDITDEQWTQYWNVNVLSGIRLSRHYLPHMLDRDDDGRIVLIGTDAAVMVSSMMMHYEVTKTAVLALARGLADLTRNTSVTVNSVIPGPTSTDGMEGVVQGIASQTGVSRDDVVDGFFAQGRPASLLQRLATPAEVANLITYLASPRSAATNGTAVRVEGGSIPTVL